MNNVEVSQEFLRTLKDVVLDRANKLKAFIENKEDDQLLIAELSRLPSYRKVAPHIEGYSYANIRSEKIAVPPGMTSTYLQYLTVLEDAVDINAELLPNVLTPFANWLAECLVDPTKLQKLSRAPSIREFKPHDVDGPSLRIGECFAKGNTAPTATFGQAFDRIKDVEPVYKQTEKLCSRFAQIDRKGIFGKTDEISLHLETLITRVEEDPEEYGLSKNSVEIVSKMSYTVAQEVEFYGATAYYLTQLCTALTETTERLKKL